VEEQRQMNHEIENDDPEKYGAARRLAMTLTEMALRDKLDLRVVVHDESAPAEVDVEERMYNRVLVATGGHPEGLSAVLYALSTYAAGFIAELAHARGIDPIVLLEEVARDALGR
jgi:hypothetical protein